MASSKAVVLIATALLAAVVLGGSGLASAEDQHRVGGKQRWAPHVDYTAWAEGEQFHLNDWLVFEYQKNMYDVLQVTESSYNHCTNADPIRNDSKGRSYVVQLNRTGWWYFICSKGYCWGGMKLAIKVEPLPGTTNATSRAFFGPAAPPEPSSAGSAPGSPQGRMWVMLQAATHVLAVAALVL